MPKQNDFHPQRHSANRPESAYELVTPGPQVDFDASASRSVMKSLGETLLRARVTRIYLVHGTLAGTDALGMIGQIQRVLPDLAKNLGELEKRFVDSLVGDVGNYTGDYAEAFESSIQSDTDTVSIRRFHWSSENHHLGRAWAALALLDEVMASDTGQRVLIWGHSHAGNVLAIMSNLIGGSADSRERFFAALKPDCESNQSLYDRMSERMRGLDSHAANSLAQSLDLVTFGTPIRYGWDTAGFSRLLHFVNHCNLEGMPEWQARFPKSIDEIRSAFQGKTGDYWQQTFIAGTNLSPSPLNRRGSQADRNLGDLLEPNSRRRDLVNLLKAGQRVAADGTTLLVDYAAADEARARQLMGHGVYTTLAWLPFHLREITSRFYA